MSPGQHECNGMRLLGPHGVCDSFCMTPAMARAQWPMNGGTGNHEEEQQADGSAFRSVRARWPVRPFTGGRGSRHATLPLNPSTLHVFGHMPAQRLWLCSLMEISGG